MDAGKGLAIAAFLFVVPLIAWGLSRWLVKGGEDAIKAMGDHGLAEWHGTYYAFDDRQVRIYEDDGRLWFIAIDVARALGWRGLPQRFMAAHAARLQRLEGTALQAIDMEGLEILLRRRREIDCGRFLRWARNDVEKPWQRRRERLV